MRIKAAHFIFRYLLNSMKKYIIVSLIGMLVLFIWYIVANNANNNSDNKTLTKEEAIALVQKQYEQFKDYPSDNLPPKVIEAKQVSQGWYLQFRQEGSGIPIIAAQCFLVHNGTQKITKTGEYKGGDITKLRLSVSSCK